jgi:F-type H+-transporting ATPase subunit b
MEENTINTQQLTTETAQPTGNAEAGGLFDTVLYSNLINVLIVIVFLVWIVRKYNILSLLAKKRNEILEAIHNVKEERRVKQNALEQTKQKVKNSDQEVAKLIDEGKEVAATLSDRAIKNAEQDAADMQKKAQSSVESESRIATNRIMQTITNSAFVIAEEHIKNTIDEGRHRKYIDDFIGKLDNLQV